MRSVRRHEGARLWTAAAVSAALWVPPCFAAPDFSSARLLAGFTVYSDTENPWVRYVGPGPIEMMTDASGRPEVHLLLVRHTGTRATGDAGSLVFRSVLTIGLRQGRPRPADEPEIRRALGLEPRVELRPLPVQRLESVVVYAPVIAQPDAPPPQERRLDGGHFEPQASAGSGREESWTERMLTLRLDPEDAQLLWSSLEAGRTALSVGYVFFARGESPELPIVEAGGLLAEGLRSRLREITAPPSPSPDGTAAPAPKPGQRLAAVRAGATSVTLDAKRYPELLRKVDIDASLPPGYAVLDVYCTDFRDPSNATVYEKEVEIEAQSVSSRPTSIWLVFRAASPEIYAQALRFPVAVRFDQPFRYRVIEIFNDGGQRASEWRSGSWSRILDISAGFSVADPEGGNNG